MTKTLGLIRDKVWSSSSNEGISFPIEDISFSNEVVSFLNEKSTLQISETNENNDSRNESSIMFEVSSWSKISDEDSELRFSTFSIYEKDEALDLISLM